MQEKGHLENTKPMFLKIITTLMMRILQTIMAIENHQALMTIQAHSPLIGYIMKMMMVTMMINPLKALILEIVSRLHEKLKLLFDPDIVWSTMIL